MYMQIYGLCPAHIPENSLGIPARISAVHRNRFEIICEFGTGFAKLKTSQYLIGKEIIPTTGDFVLLDWQAGSDSRILKTLARTTYFSRLDPSSSGHAQQAVAANFDYVFIVQAIGGDFNTRRLERYLTLAWQSGATPVVILTKADNTENLEPYILAAQDSAIGAEVFAVSAKTGYQLDKLKTYLQPQKTIVFLGSSGVGKSTLVNTLAQEQIMATNSIREDDDKGRHITSHRQLVLLKNGAMLIDTPGMRELGMLNLDASLDKSFADVKKYLGQCKFSDCKHQTEPGCQIMQAIAQGKLDTKRWQAYLKLHKEMQFTDDKTTYLKEKQEKFKQISKTVKHLKAKNKIKH